MRRGFTLIEVMIAVAIIMLLVATMYGFLHELIEMRAQARTFASHHRAINTLFDRLDQALMTCVADGGEHGPGVSGDEGSINVLTRTILPGAAFDGNLDLALGDVQRLQVGFEPMGGVLTASYGASDSTGSPSTWGELATGIYQVQFRYHDGSGWRKSFDTIDAGRLPTAVEVAVWFHRWPGAPDNEEPADLAEIGGLERETFQATETFDEFAEAMASDAEMFDVPPPDRLRVIAIPDAGDSGRSTLPEGGL